MKKAFKLFKECVDKNIFTNWYEIHICPDESGELFCSARDRAIFHFSKIYELKAFLKSKLAEHEAKNQPLNKEMFDNDAAELKKEFAEYLRWVIGHRGPLIHIRESIEEKIKELSK